MIPLKYGRIQVFFYAALRPPDDIIISLAIETLVQIQPLPLIFSLTSSPQQIVSIQLIVLLFKYSIVLEGK